MQAKKSDAGGFALPADDELSNSKGPADYSNFAKKKSSAKDGGFNLPADDT